MSFRQDPECEHYKRKKNDAVDLSIVKSICSWPDTTKNTHKQGTTGRKYSQHTYVTKDLYLDYFGDLHNWIIKKVKDPSWQLGERLKHVTQEYRQLVSIQKCSISLIITEIKINLTTRYHNESPTTMAKSSKLTAQDSFENPKKWKLLIRVSIVIRALEVCVDFLLKLKLVLPCAPARCRAHEPGTNGSLAPALWRSRMCLTAFFPTLYFDSSKK